MKKLLIIFLFILSTLSFAQTTQNKANLQLPIPQIGVSVGTSDKPQDIALTLQVLFLMTILSLAPSIVIMTTSFLRTIIVFHFLKSALGTQNMPPSQMLAGLALFITFFVMAPTWGKVFDEALTPYMDNKITIQEAYDRGIKPVREFMFRQVRNEDLALFVSLAKIERPRNREDLPTYILIPAFCISELRAGFIMGFFLFIPFLMIDMIVGSILMSMGMMMVPPMLVSLPFKILLFVLVDGWNLIVYSIVRSFK
ncbi:MAG TPA: flagellar type III secretion system pore protein FliP [Ignavibacteriales bacterium]|nr:flagellar type III secretion system pore protein FliP [Ignavibacteriales bacterium]HOL80332.1 flagellar type III secretion system pore protein FliP [Ignavibacteriales bacterium]HOM64611.1 flagellar type III secretion system pore protein FliP [Ignavibacteriales bacterium]HPD68201.1 flagellar type III secretion system pore protein FliP [Ignavibacteriales bacterium]HPP32521.1 flagellar type III secretion system pore protein FliP [Ignavibacteriales bacterium]